MKWQGAEAILEKKGNTILKTRVAKAYRLPILDTQLAKKRNKAEVKILEKASTIISVPKVISSTTNTITMEYIDGEKIRDTLNSKNAKELCTQIGNMIYELHEHSIIHSDLTTSNMIYCKKKVYFIDFGLSFISKKREDKAVDLHLLEQALISYHHELYEIAMKTILAVYNKNSRAKDVLERLVSVKKRGRNKH